MLSFYLFHRAQRQDILQYQFNIKKLGMMIENHAREAQNYVDQTNQLSMLDFILGVEIERERGVGGAI